MSHIIANIKHCYCTRVSSRKENDGTVSYIARYRRVHKAETTIRRFALWAIFSNQRTTVKTADLLSASMSQTKRLSMKCSHVKCSSIESVLLRMRTIKRKYSPERTEIARSRFLFVVTLEA